MSTKNEFPRLGEIIYWNFEQAIWDWERLNDIAEECELGLRFSPMRFLDRLKGAINATDWKNYDIIIRNEGSNYYIGVVRIQDGIRIDNAIKILVKRDKVLSWEVQSGMEQLAQQIQEVIAQWYSKIDSNYLSYKILSYIELIATRLRNRGGFYFVPEKFRDKIDKLEEFCQKIDGVALGRIGLVDEVRSREEIHQILIQETNLFMAEIKDYIKETKEQGKRLRIDGYNTRIQELNNMRMRLQNILASLNISTEALTKELDVLESEMVELKLGYDGGEIMK